MASVVELEDRWFIGANKLSHVEVEPGNARYSSVGWKCIVGKSDISCENYDTLVFLARVSVEVKIPNTIKIIGMHAFSSSQLESIMIPSHVTKICEHAFSCCKKLARVEFEPNSELRTIEKLAFYFSSLPSIKIPASVVELKDGWCNGANKLSHVEVESGNDRYSSVGGKCIVGKSDISCKIYMTCHDFLKFYRI